MVDVRFDGRTYSGAPGAQVFSIEAPERDRENPDAMVVGFDVAEDRIEFNEVDYGRDVFTRPILDRRDDGGTDIIVNADFVSASEETVAQGIVHFEDVSLSGVSFSTNFPRLLGARGSSGNDDLADFRLTSRGSFIEGEGGDDTLSGFADNVDGGAGFDMVSYGIAAGALDVFLGFGSSTNCEGLIGSAFDDTLQGDSAANRLEGGAGDDSLYGAAGVVRFDDPNMLMPSCRPTRLKRNTLECMILE